MSLDMSMILIERIVQVTINPGKLGDMAEEVRQLLILSRTLLVSRPQWVHFVKLRMDDLIGEVPMRFTLVPVELGVG